MLRWELKETISLVLQKKDPDSPRDARRELGAAILGACLLLSHLFFV